MKPLYHETAADRGQRATLALAGQPAARAGVRRGPGARRRRRGPPAARRALRPGAARPEHSAPVRQGGAAAAARAARQRAGADPDRDRLAGPEGAVPGDRRRRLPGQADRGPRAGGADQGAGAAPGAGARERHPLRRLGLRPAHPPVHAGRPAARAAAARALAARSPDAESRQHGAETGADRQPVRPGRRAERRRGRTLCASAAQEARGEPGDDHHAARRRLPAAHARRRLKPWMFSSLRLRLAAWLLLPLSLFVVISAWFSWRNAAEVADYVQDRDLMASAKVLAGRLIWDGDEVQASVPPAALSLFLSPAHDQVFLSVTGADGTLLAGVPGFPLPAERSLRGPDRAQWYDARFEGKPVRAVITERSMYDVAGAREITIAVAKTTGSR